MISVQNSKRRKNLSFVTDDTDKCPTGVMLDIHDKSHAVRKETARCSGVFFPTLSDFDCY